MFDADWWALFVGLLVYALVAACLLAAVAWLIFKEARGICLWCRCSCFHQGRCAACRKDLEGFGV